MMCSMSLSSRRSSLRAKGEAIQEAWSDAYVRLARRTLDCGASLAVTAAFVGLPTNANASDACQNLTKLKDLPASFKLVSRSALGPVTLSIKSDGTCICNDLPAVQRSLGQQAPDGVNWACDVADATDSKGK